MRFARYNERLTKAAKFKDKNSKIGLRFDGTQRIVLKGRDKMSLRAEVFMRDGYSCVDRGEGKCAGRLELSHWPPMSRSGGSDVVEQCFVRCQKHHRILDGNGQPMHF
jgi:hypothetical protein